MTPDKRADLLALAERVESGSGEDRELDAAIFCATLCPQGSKIEKSPFNGAWCVYTPKTYGNSPFRLWEKPAPWRGRDEGLTVSLDAVVALLERVLPESRALLTFGSGKRTPPEAWVYPTKDGPLNCDARATSAARALLSATLKALASQEQTS